MDFSLFQSYQKSIDNYNKAKTLLEKAEQQKKEKFQQIVQFLQPIVIKELTSSKEVDAYYLTGEGHIAVIDFFVKENSIDVFYGLLAEDDIFPNKTQTLTLHLFNF